MLYLLAAIAICLLVPWLPVVLLRLAPVQPTAPLSPEDMQCLRPWAMSERKCTSIAGASRAAGNSAIRAALPATLAGRLLCPDGLA